MRFDPSDPRTHLRSPHSWHREPTIGVVHAMATIFVGILALWAGLLLGSDLYFMVWQAMPNPPDQAYSDSGPSLLVIAGWIPGTVGVSSSSFHAGSSPRSSAAVAAVRARGSWNELRP